MDGNNKNHNKWRERDWYWLLGILIFIIILLIASIFAKNTGLEVNFSIISSAVSIALALIAIYIALKQDKDNQETNFELNKALIYMDAKLNNVGEKVSEISLEEIRKVVHDKIGYTSESIEETLNEETEKLSKNEILEIIKDELRDFSSSIDNVIKRENIHVKNDNKISSSYLNRRREILKLIHAEFGEDKFGIRQLLSKLVENNIDMSSAMTRRIVSEFVYQGKLLRLEENTEIAGEYLTKYKLVGKEESF